MALLAQGWTQSFNLASAGFGAMQYKVLYKGSGIGSVSDGATEMTISYLVNYINIAAFLDAILGYATVARAPAVFLNKVLPELHPNFQGNVNGIGGLWCTRANIAKEGVPTQPYLSFNMVVVDATFTQLDYPVLGYPAILTVNQTAPELGRFCKIEYASRIEYLQTQNTLSFVTGGAQKTLAAQPGFIVPNQVIEIDWCTLPMTSPYYSPLQVFIDTGSAGGLPGGDTGYLGHLNNANVQIGRNIYGPGTLLLMASEGRRIRQTYDAATPPMVQWNHKLTFGADFTGTNNPVFGGPGQGFNYFYNVAAPAWQLVTTTGMIGGQTVYQMDRNFNLIWSNAALS